MSLFSFFNQRKPAATQVVFAGGMGTQILQAAVYFDLELQGLPVYADLTYFSQPARLAQTGIKGELSHWPWQLNQYGITMQSFRESSAKLKKLADGEELVSKAISALSKSAIRNKFKLTPNIASDNDFSHIASNALCIHIRRGDYVNVASHLMADEIFSMIGKKFSSILGCAIILSDSPIKSDFRDLMKNHFSDIQFLDNIDALSAHRIMRHAKILVCSNSTFSLTAGLLNENGLVIIPKQWYGENEKNIEQKISAMCDFQIISN